MTQFYDLLEKSSLEQADGKQKVQLLVLNNRLDIIGTVTHELSAGETLNNTLQAESNTSNEKVVLYVGDAAQIKEFVPLKNLN